jgi:hypothetical protein
VPATRRTPISAEQKAGEQNGQAVIDAVGEDRPKPVVVGLDTQEQVTRAVRFLDGRGIHKHTE